jgi:hypothetical protein
LDSQKTAVAQTSCELGALKQKEVVDSPRVHHLL